VSWGSLGAGSYFYKADGGLSAVVVQKEELWESAVYFKGRMMDFGVWDGRSIALENANRAMKRAEALLFPIEKLNARAERGDDDDD